MWEVLKSHDLPRRECTSDIEEDEKEQKIPQVRMTSQGEHGDR